MRIVFLGTGAAGGTPGVGRSSRRESSLFLRDDQHLLIDVTRDVEEQLQGIDRDAVFLTHSHRDATGGLGKLRRWIRDHGASRLRLYGHPTTLRTVGDRYRSWAEYDARPIEPGRPLRVGRWRVDAIEVPHAGDASRVPTFAWRLRYGGRAIVYASDVARLTVDLERFSAGADVLVIDGAMWGRSIFTHLRADQALPELARWRVRRILLTQIGRTAPLHRELREVVAALCDRAEPAYDGLAVSLPD